MTLQEAITRINYALRGIDDDAPSEGSDEATYWTSVLNRKKDELFQDVTKLWQITYENRDLGTISADAIPEYTLDDDFLAPSNDPYIITLNGGRTDVPLVHPDEIDRKHHLNRAYLAGNPLTLFFANEITATDNIFGGTLYLPGYYLPDDVSSFNEDLVAPDPNWLVMSTAAEIAFNDIIYEDRSEGLNAKANNLYRLMVFKNRKGTYNNPRTIPWNVRPIRTPER